MIEPEVTDVTAPSAIKMEPAAAVMLISDDPVKTSISPWIPWDTPSEATIVMGPLFVETIWSMSTLASLAEIFWVARETDPAPPARTPVPVLRTFSEPSSMRTEMDPSMVEMPLIDKLSASIIEILPMFPDETFKSITLVFNETEPADMTFRESVFKLPIPGG